MTPKQRCDQCPNEGDCLREGADDCVLHSDPLPLRSQRRTRSFFMDLAMTSENVRAHNDEEHEVVWQ